MVLLFIQKKKSFFRIKLSAHTRHHAYICIFCVGVTFIFHGQNSNVFFFIEYFSPAFFVFFIWCQHYAIFFL